MDEPLPTCSKCKEISVIYRWRAVANKLTGPQAVTFGVVPDHCNINLMQRYQHIFLIGAYGISTIDGLIFDGSWVRSKDHNDYIAFKNSEIIRMEYEISQSNECSLSFYNESRDNQFIWRLALPKKMGNKKIMNWYPVFSKQDLAGWIRVIPF